jgi:hypothetical protein
LLPKVVIGAIRLLSLPHDENHVDRRIFDTVEEIQAETHTVLNILAKKHLQDAFQKWQKRRDWRVPSQGDNFEGVGAEGNPGKT